MRVTAGVNYFLTNQFALQCNVGSVSWTRETEVDSDYNSVYQTWDLVAGLRSLQFGILFIFGGREDSAPAVN